MSLTAEMAQGRTLHHRCARALDRCTPITWGFYGMRGGSDYTRYTWNVIVHADMTDSQGWTTAPELPTMVMVATVGEVAAAVQGMVHDGRMFAGADQIWCTAVRVDTAGGTR